MPRNPSNPLPQPVFNEGNITQDPTRFQTPHPSDSAQYTALGDLPKKDVVGVTPMRGNPADLFTLESAYGPHGPEVMQRVTTAQKIVFHAAGDTGATYAGKYKNEVGVADQMTNDCRTADEANRPRFFYHLGDVVYSFGESQYYYDQFYDPYRNYPGPIFAIPGNHDSFVIPNTLPANTPLTTFQRNFCAPQPTITHEAASLHRTAMTQPGVYFTLDAPFVRIIGLFSNALENPGVISTEKGKWPVVTDIQLDYLTKQLQAVKNSNYQGAVLIAVHHPPFSYTPPSNGSGTGGNHSSSSVMLEEIDTICKAVGVYPHAFLSAHAHNYQRFERTLPFNNKNYVVPFIVCGDGGHNVNRVVKGTRGQPAQEPHFGADVTYMDAKPVMNPTTLTLKQYDDTNYGYLRVTVDASLLRIGFHQVGAASIPQSQVDLVTVDIKNHIVVAN